jgi:light-harvesting complex I chlorophyll a/b binding protein 4
MISLILCVLATMCSTLALKPIIRPATAPFENLALFDSNVAAKDIDIVFLRESELKHGRIAMVASTAIPVIEYFTHSPAVHQFDTFPASVQLGLVGVTFIAEVTSMLKGWVDPRIKLFALRTDYQPGDLGIFNTSLDEGTLGLLMDKELNNGRLAMIAVLGMITQELVTNTPLF